MAKILGDDEATNIYVDRQYNRNILIHCITAPVLDQTPGTVLYQTQADGSDNHASKLY